MKKKIMIITIIVITVSIKSNQGFQTNLKRGKGEEDDADDAMLKMCDSSRLAAKLQPCPPSGNTKNIRRALACDMEVKPCWIRTLKNPHVSSYNNSQWHQHSPTDGIQNPVQLKRLTHFRIKR